MEIISDLWPSQGIAYTYITLSYQKDIVLDVHLLTQGLCSRNCDTCRQNPHHVDCINLYFHPQYVRVPILILIPLPIQWVIKLKKKTCYHGHFKTYTKII